MGRSSFSNMIQLFRGQGDKTTVQREHTKTLLLSFKISTAAYI